MSRPPPPPPYFPQPFLKPGTENNSRSATRSTTQPMAGIPPEPAVYHPQGGSMPSTLGACAMRAIEPCEFVVPNDGTYLPQQPAPHTSLQSSPLPPGPVRRPPAPAPAPAPALTHSYSSSPPHPPPHLPSGSVPPPPSFPVPSVPAGYGVPSNASGLVSPPSPPMERAATTYAHNGQGVGYQNIAAPGISHQRSASVGRSHRAFIVYGVPANYA